MAVVKPCKRKAVKIFSLSLSLYYASTNWSPWRQYVHVHVAAFRGYDNVTCHNCMHWVTFQVYFSIKYIFIFVVKHFKTLILRKVFQIYLIYPCGGRLRIQSIISIRLPLCRRLKKKKKNEGVGTRLSAFFKFCYRRSYFFSIKIQIVGYRPLSCFSIYVP